MRELNKRKKYETKDQKKYEMNLTYERISNMKRFIIGFPRWRDFLRHSVPFYLFFYLNFIIQYIITTIRILLRSILRSRGNIHILIVFPSRIYFFHL